MKGSRSAFNILAVEPTGERLPGRPWSRRNENVGMDLKEIGTNTRNWVDSAQDRDYWKILVNMGLNLRAR